ncbi:N-acetylmuramoyl-L-alanine amidase, family 4 [Listeria floridensis FSL S10-1187]|uniref:N-acetylmuramoyl-L-alanine amidase, family 4 n=1 Tax=Listeria floridensis FSL S10-1187 TaxID=1265817 RepID=A0ABN0RCN3_9LIST|nr:GW domain-containing glycosaminoglycan-binding protein [Listeria floridensis]EUJ27467.1 N-acetylmuramoyl-L-alanine amidase, family 4 [Listeria floridensis FSL S10-1187]
MRKRKTLNIAVTGLLLTSSFTVVSSASPILGERVYAETQALSANQVFINTLAPLAQASQERYGVLSSITLAQGILESGWGKSELTKKGNNLFGMKGRYNGNYVTMPTLEYVNGKWITINAEFRKYANWQESVHDHSLLFVNGVSWDKDHYKKVLDAPNYKVAAQELQNAGYATDPGYASKLINIVETYNLQQYDELYDSVSSESAVSGYAKVTTVSGNAVWSLPYKVKGTKLVGPASNYTNQDIQLVRKATTKRGTYYQFKQNGKVVGWIDQKALTLYDTEEYNKGFVARAAITTTAGHTVWTKPYNVYGRTQVGAAANYQKQEVKIEREAKTARGIYYQFSINEKVIGWLDKRAFTVYEYDSVVNEQKVSVDAQVAETDGHAVWSNAYKLQGITRVNAASSYANKDVKLDYKRKTQHGSYYRFAVSGKTVGWLDEKAFKMYDTVEYNKAVNLDAKITKPTSNAFWSAPYYSSGSKWVTSASTYANRDVKLIREAKTKRGTYYQVQIDGKIIGWLDKRAFKFYNQLSSNVVYSYPAIITTTAGHAIWSAPYEIVGTTLVGQAAPYHNKQVQLLRKAVTDRSTYYQFSVNGKTTGWLDTRAFDVYDNLETNKAVHLTGTVKNVTGNAVWSLPYKTIGTKFVSQAAPYLNKQAVITREAKTSRATYYLFSISGKEIGWLDKRAFANIK